MRWREELEAIAHGHKLVFEMTIAGFHVYFPSEGRWNEVVPTWAQPRWEEYRDACVAWCQQQRIPISFVDDANVSVESL
ncbi:MAG: hypothetical protein U0163_11805 [Gemmatimonadaceae bacterium]